jgi:hypothetical protein
MPRASVFLPRRMIAVGWPSSKPGRATMDDIPEDKPATDTSGLPPDKPVSPAPKPAQRGPREIHPEGETRNGSA